MHFVLQLDVFIHSEVFGVLHSLGFPKVPVAGITAPLRACSFSELWLSYTGYKLREQLACQSGKTGNGCSMMQAMRHRGRSYYILTNSRKTFLSLLVYICDWKGGNGGSEGLPLLACHSSGEGDLILWAMFS